MTEAGVGMRDGMPAADTARVIPSSNMMRYCGDDVESKGMSITVPAPRRVDGEDPRTWGEGFADCRRPIAVERNK